MPILAGFCFPHLSPCIYSFLFYRVSGLYRYRLGDVVQVSGFHNGSPKLRFVGRRKLTLMVNIDKNTEMDIQLVVAKGCELLAGSGVELIDFTSTTNLSTMPGHYVIYWELSQIPAGTGLLAECCKRMDESFMDLGYVISRKAHSINPLELCIVKKGTFMKILDHFVKDGASLSQFKTPRCTAEVLNTLQKTGSLVDLKLKTGPPLVNVHINIKALFKFIAMPSSRFLAAGSFACMSPSRIQYCHEIIRNFS